MQTTGAYAMVEALVAVPPHGGRVFGPSLELRHHSPTTLSTSVRLPHLLPRRTGSKFRARLVLRASGNSGDSSSTAPLPPLQFESPVGQFLEQILQSHPHLLPAAIDQQLENLETERESQKEGGSAPASQDPLYKRIAEVRENEKKKALEEIIYSLIVHKFLEKGISMIPRITTSDLGGRVDFWPNQQHQLESVHSTEVLEMIQSHLSLLLGDHQSVGPLDTIIEISKIKVGKLYAASIMYGYFLRRIDQRFQLDRAMNTLPEGYDENRARYEELSSNAKGLVDPQSLLTMMPDGSRGDGYGDEDGKTYRLRSHVMYLDAETLQRYATVRSKEAVGLIEKQTQALFGRPEITVAEDGSLGASNDEAITVAFSGLTMLVLEAVAFGSFMWDSESYVESKYQFLNG